MVRTHPEEPNVVGVIVKLEDLIVVYDDVLSQSDCDKLIQAFENHKDELEVHDTELYKFKQLNLNSNKQLRPTAQSYISHLSGVFHNYFTNLGFRQYVSVDAFEEVKIKKYEKGVEEQFKMHVDASDAESSIRYLVSILYLNDNDGCTEFPNLGIKVEPKAGRLLIFPPLWMYPHQGLPPTNNDKYIMMTYLHHTNKE